MKYFFSLITSSMVLLLLNGCTSQIQELKDEYMDNNKAKIKQYRALGNKYSDQGYYEDAVEAYNVVKKYEKHSYVGNLIKELTIKGKKAGKDYYAQALSVIEKDRMMAFTPLKKMMHNFPSEEGKALYEKLKNDVEVQSFLTKKEETLKKAVDNFNGSIESVIYLNNALKEAIKYNDQNELIPKAQKLVENQYSKLFDESSMLYFDKKFTEAKNSFKLLKSVYPEDEMIDSYIKLIEDKEKFAHAVLLYKNKQYKDAEAEFKVLSTIYKDNKTIQTYLKILKNRKNIKKQKETSYAKKEEPVEIEALDVEILDNEPPEDIQADKQLEVTTQKLAREKLFDTDSILQEAVSYYSKHNLDKAKELFSQILEHEPSHKIALTYLKKINQQLNTLRSLR